MPLPKPHEEETQKEFIKRCMESEIMQEEYSDTNQRLAICYQQWRRKDMEHKTIPFEIKQLNEETGIFEGYAAVFGGKPDFYGDIIDPGAFTKTLQERGKRVKVLWQHDVKEPIGKPLELREDALGLWVKAKLSLGVQRAREILSLMKDGVITELSIGYDAVKAPFEAGTRHLKEVGLWDISPVVFAAKPDAIVTSVKQGNIDALVSTWDSWAGSFSGCVAALSDKPGITDVEALCAWLHHEAEGKWPGETSAQGAIERAQQDYSELKSGRVLSAASMDKIKAALEALQALVQSAESDREEGKAASQEGYELDELDAVLAQLQGDIYTKEAEERIDELLAKLKEQKVII